MDTTLLDADSGLESHMLKTGVVDPIDTDPSSWNGVSLCSADISDRECLLSKYGDTGDVLQLINDGVVAPMPYPSKLLPLVLLSSEP